MKTARRSGGLRTRRDARIRKDAELVLSQMDGYVAVRTIAIGFRYGLFRSARRPSEQPRRHFCWIAIPTCISEDFNVFRVRDAAADLEKIARLLTPAGMLYLFYETPAPLKARQIRARIRTALMIAGFDVSARNDKGLLVITGRRQRSPPDVTGLDEGTERWIPRTRRVACDGDAAIHHRCVAPDSTGSPATLHSGKPSSRRRASKPRARRTAIASGAKTQYGPRQ